MILSHKIEKKNKGVIKKSLKNAIKVVIFTALVIYFRCGDKVVYDDTEVARVGSEIITAYDFRLSYELAPPGAKVSSRNILQRKKSFLNTIIENKLYAIAGLERNLDQDEKIQRVLKWHEREGVIKELYREEVKEQVIVTEEQLREAYILYNERLFLRQLIFNSEEEANKVYHRLQRGDTFEQIALEYADSDEKLWRILSPREFRWGELDERFETTAYGLTLNEVSVPLRSNIGYHLLQLVNRKENLILTESGFNEREHY
ncbi:MAG: peptidylprolyl isomerase, partial [Calditrichia bacterium]|nr:peptidylprolyl isomerase [Calditrichia bacterium]